tara:strand:- start:1261 stop:1776 length:516 start_codon:yes stop_codon:yes gene_type:complete
MSESTIMLNGVDEGITVIISTTVAGAESPNLVIQSVQNIFPDFDLCENYDEPKFGKTTSKTLRQENISMNNFLKLLHKQSILDTALDIMSMNLVDNETNFQILRQASIAGKVAFNITEKIPLGGVIDIQLSGEGLKDWIEAATWHKGRDFIPRHIDDERKMDNDGEASTWI